MFDKKTLSKKFSQSVNNYDEEAYVQNISAQNLCQLVQPYINHQKKSKSNILDLGSGTSFISNNLNSEKTNIFEVDLSLEMLNYSHSKENIFKIQSDIENLPLQNNQFDVITSSFSLQWLNDLATTFSNLNLLLKSEGIFAFCIPVAGSLNELRAANIFNFNALPTIDNVKLSIKNAGFKEISLTENIIKQEFPTAIEAVKSIKRLGANHSPTAGKPITKLKLAQFNSFCLKNFSNQNKNIQISWNICYFLLKKD